MAWKIIDLTGTKDGANTDFVIPFDYLAATITIFHQGAGVYIKSSGTPLAGECVVANSLVTMGTAPASTDTLWCRGFET